MRFKVAAITAATLLGAGLATVGYATPALAVTNASFCALDQNSHLDCAYKNGSYVDMESAPGGLWNYPVSGTHEIEEPGNVYCMTVDSSNMRIVLDKCTGATDQEWAVTTTDIGYSYKNKADGKCLNDHYQLNQLNVTTCSAGPNQAFGYES